MVEPVLKWAGGKRQLLDEIRSRFPVDYDHYHEPFFGGGAVFFALSPNNGTINDTNPRLINFYEQVRDRPDDLIDRLEEFADPEDDPDPTKGFATENWKGKEVTQYFYQQRSLFNRRPYSDDKWPSTADEKLEEAALLLYLNRTCYNGLYRENSSGGFNVPIGRYANPNWVMADRIEKASEALEGTEILNEDFDYILDIAEPGDLIYLDPPYKPMSATSNFAEYSADGFDQEDQKRLLEVVKQLDRVGVHFVLSNSGVMFEMYDKADFYVEREGATRSINSDGDSRGEVDEIIATNVPIEERQKPPNQQSLGQF